jgi:hypothetical protein
MSSPRFATHRPRPRPASDFAGDAKLTDSARALLAQVDDPGAFVAQLMEKRLYPDAIRFSAHRLPRALAIWWGCLCVWEVSRPAPTAAAEAALKGVLDWLRESSEDNRRQAETLAEAAGMDTPAGLLAYAVFMNSGSLTPPHLPSVAPKTHLTPNLVANAVLLASRTAPPEATLQRQFLGIARDVLEGRSHWKA